MMKKIKVLLFSVMVFSLLPATAYAQPRTLPQGAERVEAPMESIISTPDVSRVIGTPRGSLISLGTIQISDEGKGVLGVYADTLCHVKVDEIDMTIYLDIFNEETNDWDSLNYYEYVWKAADMTDHELTNISVSFDLYGLRRKRTYRLQCFHVVKDASGYSEALFSETFGLELG